MKSFLGVEIGAVVCVLLVSEDGRIVSRVVEELPQDEELRAARAAEALARAMERLPARTRFEAVGVAVSPPREAVLDSLFEHGAFNRSIPLVGGRKPEFLGYEVEALYPFHGGGHSKAWLILGDRPRLYVEEADFGDEIRCRDEKGIDRRTVYAACADLLLPLKVLRSSFGLFENYAEIEETAALVQNSDGVRIARREDGVDFFGVDPTRGIRRPQICRAALESSAMEVRTAISDLAGEAVVREIYVAGPAARNRLLLELIADFIAVPVLRSEVRDAVAFGAASRAAHAIDATIHRPDRTRLIPTMPAFRRDELYARWLTAKS